MTGFDLRADEGRGAPLGVVLAAGAGTRYGMPKILAEQGGWLDRAVAALHGGGCLPVLVAMGAAQVEVPSGAEALIVADWADGLSATVGAAVRAARIRPEVPGVVLHVVDTPDVSPAVVQRVVSRAAGRRDALVRGVYHGRPGHPVYLGAAHFDGVLAALGGDVGAGPYLRAHATAVLDVECGDLATGLDHDEPDT